MKPVIRPPTRPRASIEAHPYRRPSSLAPTSRRNLPSSANVVVQHNVAFLRTLDNTSLSLLRVDPDTGRISRAETREVANFSVEREVGGESCRGRIGRGCISKIINKANISSELLPQEIVLIASIRQYNEEYIGEAFTALAGEIARPVYREEKIAAETVQKIRAERDVVRAHDHLILERARETGPIIELQNFNESGPVIEVLSLGPQYANCGLVF